MADRYRSFEELAAHERETIDWQVRSHVRPSPVAIFAPHGGKIEPGTTELAEAIAGEDFSFYTFEGIRSGYNSRLRLAGEVFDEPECLKLLNRCSLAVSVHGVRTSAREIYIGGGNTRIRGWIVSMLKAAGFQTIESVASGPADICNRPSPGLRLDVAKGLRDHFESSPHEMDRFVATIRAALLQETMPKTMAAG